jgi:DNA-binding transcriptional LysR family regulator
MSTLPDLEALAIFAKVTERRSFAGAAEELRLSKATVSKAVARLEARLGTRLFNRTSRRLALTEPGRVLAARAASMLAEGEAAEAEALFQSAAPRGLVRISAPLSFGVRYLAPIVPELLRLHPELAIDMHLNDAQVDLIGEGFDAVLRIAALPDSSLVARKLCDMPAHVLAAPSYLKAHGRPRHPLELAERPCIAYAYQSGNETWRFRKSSGESASVRPTGQLRVNNGDAMLPALEAGLGFAILPQFIAGEAVAAGRLEIVLPEWRLPASAVYWLSPPGGPRPRRVEAVADFFAGRLGAKPGKRVQSAPSKRGPPRPARRT